jgi:hypothetical protein
VNALRLYHDLKARGAILEAQGERLKVDAPAGVLTEEHKAALNEFKPKLLKLLSIYGTREVTGAARARELGPLGRARAYKDTRPVHGRMARVACG